VKLAKKLRLPLRLQLVESQLFGNGVAKTITDINFDSDIKEALKSIKQLLLCDILTALKKEHNLDQHAVDKPKDDCNSVESLWTSSKWIQFECSCRAAGPSMQLAKKLHLPLHTTVFGESGSQECQAAPQ